MTYSNHTELSPHDIERCIVLLERLAQNGTQLARLPEAQRIALMTAAGQLSRPDRDQRRQRTRAKQRADRRAQVDKERQARAATGIRQAREDDVFVAPKQIVDELNHNHTPLRHLNSPRNCYVCKAPFTQLHHFYDSMCMSCAEFNYEKRFQSAPLHGQVAVITGSRLKIGYQATLMMLRAGATVIATTRFPVDSALRYARAEDYTQWRDRLHIYGLDLRHTPSVELFTRYVQQTYDRLDLLINNAAQTVRRPPGFYAHLMENETKGLEHHPQDVASLLAHYQQCVNQIGAVSHSLGSSDLPIAWDQKTPGLGLRASAQLSQIPYTHDHSLVTEAVFPQGHLDADLQQVDLREVNSWRLRLGEIQTVEMLELQLVNAIAPFVLCNALASLMKRANTGQKHVVNVTAMEGKFFRFKKDSRHPHTNMAKAALN
ncbi:SDR family NAD(P)-dependent oxidoreductase, partial [Planctomycetota bacterium]